MDRRLEVVRGSPEGNARVRELRSAYHARRLVVSDDPGALAQAKRHGARAIDAREVADAMLRALGGPWAGESARRRRGG